MSNQEELEAIKQNYVEYLVSKARTGLNESTSIRELESGTLELTTPFLLPNNDYIQIYLEVFGITNQRFKVHDDSETYIYLVTTGCRKNEAIRRLAVAAETFHLGYSNNTLFGSTGQAKLAETIDAVVQAMNMALDQQ
jgi:hypothetical protein